MAAAREGHTNRLSAGRASVAISLAEVPQLYLGFSISSDKGSGVGLELATFGPLLERANVVVC